jgi:hypothetical protein
MPVEDRISYLSNLAESAFDEGASLEQVEAMLDSEGVPAGRACEIVETRSAKVRSEIRRAGWKQVLFGLFFMAVSSMILIASSASGQMVVVLYGLFIFGFALLGSGVRCLATGKRTELLSFTECDG